MKRKLLLIYLSAIIVVLFLLSAFKFGNCQTKKNIDETSIAAWDSISLEGELIRYFGEDSVYIYRENGTLRLITYLNEESYIGQKAFYQNGQISVIEYSQPLHNDLKEIGYFPSGMIEYKEYEKDSIVFFFNNPIRVHKLREEYYEDGVLSERGCTGDFLGQIVYVGGWCYYNESGELIKKDNYIYPPQPVSTTSIYENAFYYFIREYFHTNGRLKTKKICSNWAETDYPHTPIGTWIEYDQKGNVIETKKYSYFNESTGRR